MRIVAIINQKGGTGKTTTAVNLGAALAERGVRVLLVDLDAQQSATRWLAAALDGVGLYEVLTAAPDAPRLVDLICPSGIDGLDVVAGSRYLSGVERAMAREPVGAETVLRTALAGLPAGRWEVVLLDCPPALGLLSISALVAAGDVLVPVETQVMALDGLAALLDTLAKVRATLNPGLGLASILPCRVDRTRLAREVMGALRDRLGTDVLTTQIRQSVRLAEAPSHRRPILTYAPASTGAEDYRALAAELHSRVLEGATA